MGIKLKSLARRSLYETGALAAWHRWRRDDTLTVALFHRVLPDGDSRWRRTDPSITLSADGFRDGLSFLRRHYEIVALDDVLANRRQRRPLPPRALLITFDDGWADSLEVAAPILEEFGLPAALFAASDAIQDQDSAWWQAGAAHLVRSGGAPDRLVQAAQDGDELAFLDRLYRMSVTERRQVLAAAMSPERGRCGKREMLSCQDLRSWRARGFAVAAHGAAHMPLTALSEAEVKRDLEKSRGDLARLLGADAAAPEAALAFPHGRYDDSVIQIARDSGFEVLFTSEPCVNALDNEGRCSDLLGRIAIDATAVGDAGGRLRPERLASWLFARKSRRLDA